MASDVKLMLFQYGFGYAWIEQQVGNKTKFLRVLKQRLIDCFKQDWHAKIFTSERFCEYKSFKYILKYENYLFTCTIRRYRDVLVRFRVGVNELNCNKYRYSTNGQLKLCPLCGAAEEDGIHFIFACGAYNDIRENFVLNNVLSYIFTIRDATALFQSVDAQVLAKYIIDCFQSRKDKLNNRSENE